MQIVTRVKMIQLAKVEARMYTKSYVMTNGVKRFGYTPTGVPLVQYRSEQRRSARERSGRKPLVHAKTEFLGQK